jgi:hypothetical protein
MGIPPLMARPLAHHLANWSAFDPVTSFAVLPPVAACAGLRFEIPIGRGLPVHCSRLGSPAPSRGARDRLRFAGVLGENAD